MRGSKYPNISVQLSGSDGNAFAVIGLISIALKKNGVDAQAIADFKKEAMSGDYDNVLITCMSWVNIT